MLFRQTKENISVLYCVVFVAYYNISFLVAAILLNTDYLVCKVQNHFLEIQKKHRLITVVQFF